MCSKLVIIKIHTEEMRMKKFITKTQKIIFSVCLSVCIAVCGVLGWIVGLAISRRVRNIDFSLLAGETNKVVLFIGDGMGENHVKATELYYDTSLFMTSLEKSGKVTTFSNSWTSATDSAAAASALATGHKYDNKEVSRHNGIDIKTISEQAKEKGFGVGIVTTDSLNGATPSAFSSHADGRGDSEQILIGQLNSQIDLFLGAGKNFYMQYEISFSTEQNYTMINKYSELSETSTKIFGCFDKVVAQDGTDETPTLEMLVQFALKYFEYRFPDGYFLMIEGAHIDKCSHDNDIKSMMQYLVSFDNCIEQTYNEIGEQNVAIIVTADHETGALKSTKKKSKINDKLYGKSGHSGRQVPYYIYINSKNNVNINEIIPNKIDNTDIYKISSTLLFG